MKDSLQKSFEEKLHEELQKVPQKHRQELQDSFHQWLRQENLTLKFQLGTCRTTLGPPTRPDDQHMQGRPRKKALGGYSRLIPPVLYHCQEKQKNINGTPVDDGWIYLNDILDYLHAKTKKEAQADRQRNTVKNSILDNLSVLKFVSVELNLRDPFWCLLELDEPVQDAHGNLHWDPPQPQQPVKDHRGDLLFRFRLNRHWAKRVEVLQGNALCPVDQMGITPSVMQVPPSGPAGVFPLHWLRLEAQIVQHLDAGRLKKAQACINAALVLRESSELWKAFEARVLLLKIQLLFQQGEFTEAVGLFNDLEQHKDPDLDLHWCYHQVKHQVKLNGNHTIRDLHALQQELQDALEGASILKQARLQLLLAQVQQKLRREGADNHAVELAHLAHLIFLTEHHMAAAEQALLVLTHIHHQQSTQHRNTAFRPWGHTAANMEEPSHLTDKQRQSLEAALDGALWLWDSKTLDDHRDLDGRLPVLIFRILRDLNARLHPRLLQDCMRVLMDSPSLWNKLQGWAIHMALVNEGMCEEDPASSLEQLKRHMPQEPRLRELYLKQLTDLHPPLRELLARNRNTPQVRR